MPQIVPIPSEEHGLLKALHPVLPSVRNIAMPRYLQSLWITHVRFLIQSIHETLSGRDISALPASLIQEVRVGVKVVLSNMILLGSVKIEGGHSFDAPEQYYIPPFSTVAFAMTEHFVQLAGFHGDDHADFRNTVLSTVAHFQYCMVVRPGYLSHPVDAPGFSFDVLDPFEYGVGTHTKATQIAEVNSHGGLAHAFGQNLPRYCPESASEGLVYRFPVCPEEFRFAPTRPNTPIPELVPIVE
ncbi:hypothetical protein DFH06DRAFT_1346091 [Mycena polygramma]|nr:hypothetical protein C8R47DRAFT_1231229 [Mycena vitilis]KAJ7602982.1 hypothetical protein DFH06DRAFT_1350704 [Mycena polygramma]KAJ6449841.1 hypothetical protein C8R47DRAFT_1230509 [Mycena vitilis]KAJ6482809.1 hypothetical protein C8R47DRAFT_1217728 [Mycena vitilis]KAJ6482814.1 hypothetical protein C8R47DRAFT_1217738 [Mycena vitilis]